MTDYIEDSIELEFEEIFNDWYEIEGVRKIKELSRQLRTFFNYKTEVIRYRFRSNKNNTNSIMNIDIYTHKQKIESLSQELLNKLNELQRNGQTLEQGIRFLFIEKNRKQIFNLSEIVEKLSTILHLISEDNLHLYPIFLKFIVILAQNICFVKRCLQTQFKDFFEELEINYNNLERELKDLLDTTPIETKNKKKQLGRGLIS
ncbi:MAG: hypothetical protein EU542_03635 [Promethearchaeota archaeon]|nr:MAG: hypothetical protein EU542_03635 [Candidatus Lokiarchaeota archaeon]